MAVSSTLEIDYALIQNSVSSTLEIDYALKSRVVDVIIPATCQPIVVGPPITGQHIVGECVGADTYQDYALALDGGSGQVLVGQIIVPAATGVLELPRENALLVIAADLDVAVTGMLDLPREPDTILLNQRNLYLAVENTGGLELAGDFATLFAGKSITLQSVDQPLELSGGPVRLTIEVIIRIQPDAVIPLELLGGDHTHINPPLILSVCLDLDSELVTCTPLDSLLVACDDLDLDTVVCLGDGQLTILATFLAGERVLHGSDVIWSRPLTDCKDLTLQPVGCAD